MKISIKSLTQKTTRTDLLVVFALEGAKPQVPGGIEIVESALDSFAGSARELRLTDAIDGPASRILLVGLGDEEATPLDPEQARRCGALVASKAEEIEAASATVLLDCTGDEAGRFARAFAEGLVMGGYRLEDFRRDAEPAHLERVTLHADRTLRPHLREGEIIGKANCLARRLQDTPGNRMRPRDLVEEAEAIAADSEQVSLKVFDEKAMKRMKMGSLLSVSRGSEEPAYLIHLVYRPKKKARGRVCFVGKGLTFDAGGISLKPSAKMDEMKYDMSGGAAVLGAMAAAAGLEPDVEVHALVPASENLPDGKANKPGDLVTAMNGLTIEVLNTDAEGRLILADALCYADEKIRPDAMIDLATLTGAVVVGLGHEYSGAMGNDEDLVDSLVAAGKRSGELVWPLPIHERHRGEMKGTVGDLKNISSPGAGAGSSTAGAFLENFVGEIPWVHLDIAGSAWGAADRDYQGGSKGTGVGVRLLVDYLEAFCESRS